MKIASNMFSDLSMRVKKAGQPPGSPIFTGDKTNVKTKIHVVVYAETTCREYNEATLNLDSYQLQPHERIWIHVNGLQDLALMQTLAEKFQIHPLVIEDILNVGQRPKVNIFEHYLFITFKMLLWGESPSKFKVEQVGLILGKDFILTFNETNNPYFDAIRANLISTQHQPLCQHQTDYLAYRLIDIIVDYYYLVLENLGERIEAIEDVIISNPQPKNTQTLHQLKRQLILIRKAIWPLREVISHLMQLQDGLIMPETMAYFHDLYDHVVQAIDTIETFRDMLASMLDIYLSTLSNRMNDIMKTLTIIATIFIPLTFITGLFGMNFVYIPGVTYHYGYFVCVGFMGIIVLGMVVYFFRRRWV